MYAIYIYEAQCMCIYCIYPHWVHLIAAASHQRHPRTMLSCLI